MPSFRTCARWATSRARPPSTTGYYFRKHGHGRPWRHAFVVKRVKPHAVLLEVPKDGSVPDVLPWQSLRKCSFAAPHFHDDELPLPAVDDRGLATTRHTSHREEAEAEAAGDWLSWSAAPKYDIDKILSARRVGRGWTLQVRWKGYPDPTPEPLSGILRDTQNHEVLADIARCQAEYLAQNPSERADFTADEVRPQPTRVQPARAGKEPTIFAINGVSDSVAQTQLTSQGLRALSRASKLRSRALKSFIHDFRGLSYWDRPLELSNPSVAAAA